MTSSAIIFINVFIFYNFISQIGLISFVFLWLIINQEFKNQNLKE